MEHNDSRHDWHRLRPIKSQLARSHLCHILDCKRHSTIHLNRLQNTLRNGLRSCTTQLDSQCEREIPLTSKRNPHSRHLRTLWLLLRIWCSELRRIVEPGNELAGSGLNFIFSTGVGSTDIYDATFFSLFALSLVFLPFRKSAARIYETAPVKYGGKMGMALIGAVGLVANLYIAYMIITAEYQAGWMLLATGIIAALIYVYYKYGKSKEVDYSTIFAQIPPERS